jgi:hypothetical protein
MSDAQLERLHAELVRQGEDCSAVLEPLAEEVEGLRMTEDHRSPCLICGQGAHRYGTTDPEHKYDAMGCVNMLIPLLREIIDAVDVSDLPYPDEERLAPLIAKARRAWRSDA